jgi:Zn-dependent protease
MDTALLSYLIVVFGSITLHEYGHAKSADAAGDPTPRAYGRVTLNPFAHFDPIGAIMICILIISGFGLGWGKPVPTNPARMQNPRWDSFMSVLWGPLTNLILAVVFALLLRFVAPSLDSMFFSQFCFIGVTVNIGLFLFNLIPIGPLDGHWLVGLLLPEPLGARFLIWSRQQGTLILFGVIIIDQVIFRSQGQPGIIGTLIWQPAQFIYKLLLG